MGVYGVGTEVLVDDGGGYGPGWGKVVDYLENGYYLIEFGDGHRASYHYDDFLSADEYQAVLANLAEHY